MTVRQRQWLGAFFFVLMFGHFGVNAYSSWLTLGKLGKSYEGWDVRVQPDGKVEILRVDLDGPAAMLRSGDEFVSINGINLQSDPQILNYSQRVPPGTRYTIVVRRQGQLLEFSLSMAAYPLSRWLAPIADVLVQLIFLLTGLIVFILKPTDRQAWLLALMLGAFTGLFNDELPPLPVAMLPMVAAARIIGLWFLPAFFNFFLIFPERSPLLTRFPRLERWLYWPFYLIVPWFSFTRLMVILRSHKQWEQYIRDSWVLKHRWIGLLALSVALSYLIAGLGALFVGYRAANVAARRKLYVIVAGSGAGAVNLLLLIVWESFFQVSFPRAKDWLAAGLKFTLPLIPLSFAYAIIRHRVIPVSLILRRGVRYLLVSRGSMVLHLALAALVMFLVMDTIFSRTPSLAGRPAGVISAIVGILVWNLNYWFHRRVLAPAIDRRFFRQSYNAQQIIADLTQSLRTVSGLPQLLELVATKIQSALQTENVTIFLRNEQSKEFQAVYTRTYQQIAQGNMQISPTWRFLPDAEVIRQLTANGQPIVVEADEQPSEGESNGHINVWQEAEWKILCELKTSLLLPLAAKDEALGFISLGARLGDLPFSSADKHLLMSVAGPATFAIENARLVERMIEEARRREEIEAENEQRAKELEEARQLQLSMLPKHLPQLPHLQIAAYMKTATEVGGDYYDFHLSDNGELTIVVGDATGHGLKAGTVVTATKSLFNHLGGMPNVTEFFQHSSRALKLMNLRSLYMAMTMVKVRGYQMTISSAGMPPVLIYRANENRVEEISVKGIPLGSLIGYVYREEEVTLLPGDVVVLLSDGFPERFNSDGEMLGYDIPGRSLAEVAHRSPQMIIEHFVAMGDAWAGKQTQDDDVTFVVLKLNL